MVKGDREPAIGRMAGITGGTVLPFVLVVPGVAGVAIGWRTFKNSIDMTAGA